MILDNQAENEKKDLSLLMLEGQLLARKTKKKTIYVVGETRVGKSTYFNYMVGVRLTGVREKGQTVYKPSQDDGAETSHRFKSVTILPNIEDIKIESEEGLITLQDMAGFNDQNRSYKGVFMVSYVLKRSFNYAEDAKFILVCEEPNLMIGQIEETLKPFLNFVNMFNKEEVFSNASVMNSLMSSVVLVITKARLDWDEYKERLEAIKEHLEEEENLIVEKRLMIALIKNLLDNKRIELFAMAKKDIGAPKCTLKTNMAKPERNWNWFKFKENEDLVEIPFARDYRRLKEDDQKKFSEFIDKKLQMFPVASSILQKFIKKGLECMNRPKIYYTAEHQQLKKFVEEYDKYKIEQIVEESGIVTVKPEKWDGNSVNELEFISKIQQIFKITHHVNDTMESSKDNHERFCKLKHAVLKALEIYKNMFCHTKEEEINFIKYIFIVTHAIEELASMNKIENPKERDPVIKALFANIGSEAIQIIKDKFIDNTQDSHKINSDYLLSCTIKEGTVEIIQTKIEELLDKAIDLQSDIINKLYKKLLEVGIYKGSLELKKMKYTDALTTLLKTLSGFVDLQERLKSSENFRENFKDDLATYEIQIYQKIGKSLEGEGRFKLALEVYECKNFVPSMSRCYELMIKNEPILEKKYSFRCKQVEFLKKYAQPHNAIKIYQVMVEEFYTMPAKMRMVKEQQMKLLTDLPTIKYGDYRGILNKELEDSDIDTKLSECRDLMQKGKEELQKIKNKVPETDGDSKGSKRSEESFEDAQVESIE